MLLMAFVRPLWAATLRALRQLTRLAVTALVLVAGPGGITAAPTTTASRPSIVTSRVAEVRTDRATVAESVTDDPTERAPLPSAEAGQRAAAPRPPTAVARTDPGGDALGRRGPPRA